MHLDLRLFWQQNKNKEKKKHIGNNFHLVRESENGNGNKKKSEIGFNDNVVEMLWSEHTEKIRTRFTHISVDGKRIDV